MKSLQSNNPQLIEQILLLSVKTLNKTKELMESTLVGVNVLVNSNQTKMY